METLLLAASDTKAILVLIVVIVITAKRSSDLNARQGYTEDSVMISYQVNPEIILEILVTQNIMVIQSIEIQ